MAKTAEVPMSKPTIILVGADKGGVGKTTVTRTLLDYLESKTILRRAFDTEYPRGALKRFHPDITRVIDIGSASDQMTVFDTLRQGETTVIDVRAGQLLTTLMAMRDIGFLDATQRGDYNVILFHILGPSIGSLDEIAHTAELLTGVPHILVKNFINNTTFFDWDPATTNAYFKKIKGIKEIEVKRLNELACEQVELAGVSYSSFIANRLPEGRDAPFSFVLRGYVRHWLQNVFAEYDRVGLVDMIDSRRRAERPLGGFTEPSRPEPAKVEVARVETARTEPARVEAVRAEPPKVEAPKPAAAAIAAAGAVRPVVTNRPPAE